MYNIIRLIIIFAVLFCSIIAIKKSQAIRKHIWYTAFTGLSVLLFVVLTLLPFENLVVTFDSPKAAYEYYNLGNSSIELVVEGKDSDFLVDGKSDSDTYLIIPKTADGWKIGIGLNTKCVVQKSFKGIVLYVYQYKNTNDYFVTILDTNGGESIISDKYNTKFYSREKNNNSLGKTFVTYYAHITNFNSTYSVTVNGNEIALGNQ